MENRTDFKFTHFCEEWALNQLRFLRARGIEGILKEDGPYWVTVYRDVGGNFHKPMREYCDDVVQYFEAKMREVPAEDFPEEMKEVMSQIIGDWKEMAEAFRTKDE